MDEKPDKKLEIHQINSILEKFDSDTADWLEQAEASWSRYKAEDKQRVYKRKGRNRKYPLWWATQKVRQPLVFSRLPDLVVQPILEDRDGVISQACVVVEKLGTWLMNEFPMFRVMVGARDDALNTCLGVTRIMLTAEVVTQPKRIPLQEIEVLVPALEGDGMVTQVQIVDESGEPVDPAYVVEDGQGGLYTLSDEQEEKVTKESVTLKKVSYKSFIWDQEATEFSEWEYCAFRSQLNTRQIVERWGQEALSKLAPREDHEELEAREQHEIIEFWHKPTKKRYILVEGGDSYLSVTDDPYELEQFFPIAYPIFDNLGDEGTIPTCEYQQVRDQLDHIDELFNAISTYIRIARPRALYDKSIPELSTLISKAAGGDFIGIPNLAAKLQSGQTMVQFLDVAPILQALQSIAAAWDKEIESYDQVTGFSDVLRGITNPFETATATERAQRNSTHRLAPLQEDMQRFAKDVIKSMIDLALGKFSDERLEEILLPTLDQDELAAWPQILKILRDDRKWLMTIDIETNSTIMIDEESEKQQALELAQVLGGYLQQMAAVLQQSPAFGEIMAKILDHVCRKIRGGRAFIDDVTQAIDAMQEQIQAQAQQPPPPNKDQINAQIQQAKLQLEAQKLQMQQMQAQVTAQLKQAELSLKAQAQQVEMIQADRTLSVKEREQMLNEQMAAARLEIDQVMKSLEIQEKFMEEARLRDQNLQAQSQPQQPIVQPVVIQPMEPIPMIGGF